MNAEEIADALNKKGLIHRDFDSANGTTLYAKHGQPFMPAKTIINDWQVAGLCLEQKDFHFALERDLTGQYLNGQHFGRRETDGSICRTICEAYALSQEDKG